MTASGVPHARLSAFYFVYFAAIGALVPYFNPYLHSLGYDAAEIGQATAILLVGRVVAPGIWGWLADRSGDRLRMVQVTSLLAALTFAFVFVADSFARMALVLLFYGLFWSASLPQFEAITLNHLGPRLQDYTRIRLWGSVGFIVTAGLLGPLLQDDGIALLPWFLLAFIAAVWVAALTIPAEPRHQEVRETPARFLAVLRQPGVLVLFGAALLMQLSCGPYYAFYTIFLEDRGYTRTSAGLLWALGVLAEVVLFTMMHRLMPAWGLRRLMLVSLAAGVLRWLLVGYGVDSPPIIVFAQLLHAATFGMHHASAVQYVHRYFVGVHQGRGQALYSSIAYGVGGAISAYCSGQLWLSLGPQRTFTIAAGLCALGLVLAWRWLDEGPSHPEPGRA